MREQNVEMLPTGRNAQVPQLRPNEEATTKDNHLTSQLNSLLIGRMHSPHPAIFAHTEALQQVTGSRHSSFRRPFLQKLQQIHGNRYVQRMVALAYNGEGKTEVNAETEEVIERARGGGQPLDERFAAQMKTALGWDLSGVRVHTDNRADVLNQELNAIAFASGRDIFFSSGAYNPRTQNGRWLLAHEVTHTVQQMGSKVRCKLTVGQVGDQYEQEADRIADQVVRMPDSELKSDSNVEVSATSRPVVRRLCTKCEEELHRKSVHEREDGEGAPQLTPKMEAKIKGLRGGGQPLSPSTRRFFEPRFGRDLGAVRIHTDAASNLVAEGVNAQAFTIGNDIFFGIGHYAPETSEGRSLVAHELAHVLQQSRSSETVKNQGTAKINSQGHRLLNGITSSPVKIARQAGACPSIGDIIRHCGFGVAACVGSVLATAAVSPTGIGLAGGIAVIIGACGAFGYDCTDVITRYVRCRQAAAAAA